MSDIAIDSQGTTMSIGSTGSPPSFSAIPEIISISGPDGQNSWQDTTDLSSTAKEGRPGLSDEGQVRLRINYVPNNTVHESMRQARVNKTLKAWQIAYTDSAPSSIFEFSGYVINFAPNVDVDNPTHADVTVRITGAVSKVQ